MLVQELKVVFVLLPIDFSGDSDVDVAVDAVEYEACIILVLLDSSNVLGMVFVAVVASVLLVPT